MHTGSLLTNETLIRILRSIWWAQWELRVTSLKLIGRSVNKASYKHLTRCHSTCRYEPLWVSYFQILPGSRSWHKCDISTRLPNRSSEQHAGRTNSFIRTASFEQLHKRASDMNKSNESFERVVWACKFAAKRLQMHSNSKTFKCTTSNAGSLWQLQSGVRDDSKEFRLNRASGKQCRRFGDDKAIAAVRNGPLTESLEVPRLASYSDSYSFPLFLSLILVSYSSLLFTLEDASLNKRSCLQS